MGRLSKLVRDYVSIVEFIQALQYFNNKDEIVRWLGNKNCNISNGDIYVHVSNAQNSVKLIRGDYVIKTEKGVFKVIPQRRFEESYHLLPVSLDDSFKMMFKESSAVIK